ncbi:MAG: 7-cyano-7-deazaguanine synthase QueC [Opitutales bacterium]|nr:7-cyano-7-deazaguanine synthase QueC [Opitutales bacterium]
MKSVVLIYSGGLDSTVLLYDCLAQGIKVRTLSINYGQKHSKELLVAHETTTQLGIEHRCVDLSCLGKILNSSLTITHEEIPEGHYEAENMKATVVPNRNMILLSIAAGWAISTRSDAVAYGAHGGDHAIYPDCRESFADALDKAIQLADWHPVTLWRPYVHLNKTDLVKKGMELGVPFAKTWSCYKGGHIHCGKCGTCRERKEAFSLAGVYDPTTYAG